MLLNQQDAVFLFAEYFGRLGVELRGNHYLAKERFDLLGGSYVYFLLAMSTPPKAETGSAASAAL
jgi:hypothetical protein